MLYPDGDLRIVIGMERSKFDVKFAEGREGQIKLFWIIRRNVIVHDEYYIDILKNIFTTKRRDTTHRIRIVFERLDPEAALELGWFPPETIWIFSLKDVQRDELDDFKK